MDPRQSPNRHPYLPRKVISSLHHVRRWSSCLPLRTPQHAYAELARLGAWPDSSTRNLLDLPCSVCQQRYGSAVRASQDCGNRPASGRPGPPMLRSMHYHLQAPIRTSAASSLFCFQRKRDSVPCASGHCNVSSTASGESHQARAALIARSLEVGYHTLSSHTPLGLISDSSWSQSFGLAVPYFLITFYGFGCFNGGICTP